MCVVMCVCVMCVVMCVCDVCNVYDVDEIWYVSCDVRLSDTNDTNNTKKANLLSTSTPRRCAQSRTKGNLISVVIFAESSKFRRGSDDRVVIGAPKKGSNKSNT